MPSSAELLDYLRRRLSQPGGAGQQGGQPRLVLPVEPPPAEPPPPPPPPPHLSPIARGSQAGREGGAPAPARAPPRRTQTPPVPPLLEKYKAQWVSLCDRHPGWCRYIGALLGGGEAPRPDGPVPPDLLEFLAAVARDLPDDAIAVLEKGLGIPLSVIVKLGPAKMAELLLEYARMAREALERKAPARISIEKLRKLLAPLALKSVRGRVAEELAKRLREPPSMVSMKLHSLVDALSRGETGKMVRSLASLYKALGQSKAYRAPKTSLQAAIREKEEEGKGEEAAERLAAIKSLLRR